MSTDSDSFVNIHSEGSKTDSDTASTFQATCSASKISSIPISQSTSNNKVDDMAYNSWQDLEQEAVCAWVDKTALTQIVEKHKIHREICKHNIKQLIHIARHGSGFIFDDLRRMAWPLITDTRTFVTSPTPDEATIKAHSCYYQVCMDVDRSIKRFPPSVKEVQRLAIQEQLVVLIMRLLIANPPFHYYQGFHDICVTFLLVLGEERSFTILDSITKTHLREFLEPTMEKTSILLELIPLIIEKEDEQLFAFLERSGVGTIFALSWVLTWFSHVLKNYDNVGRMFDFFLSTDKLMPFYFSAAILLHRKQRIMQLDCDMASVHQYLSRLVEEEEDDLPFDQLIRDANHLFSSHKLPYAELEIRYGKVQTVRRPNRSKLPLVVQNLLQILLGHKGMLIASFVAVLVATFLGNNYRNKITQ